MKSGLPTNVDHVLMYMFFSSSIRTVLFVGLTVSAVSLLGLHFQAGRLPSFIAFPFS